MCFLSHKIIRMEVLVVEYKKKRSEYNCLKEKFNLEVANGDVSRSNENELTNLIDDLKVKRNRMRCLTNVNDPEYVEMCQRLETLSGHNIVQLCIPQVELKRLYDEYIRSLSSQRVTTLRPSDKVSLGNTLSNYWSLCNQIREFWIDGDISSVLIEDYIRNLNSHSHQDACAAAWEVAMIESRVGSCVDPRDGVKAKYEDDF